MPKPWARIEVGRMRHPKFLALNGNAIALWDEGKDYCDEHHTDGIIPREALKTFRFAGPKSVAMLTASCGQKFDGTPYAPLWEPHDLGYRMHDYLAYNDCRDAVLARLEQAEENRAADRERLKRWRESKKQRRETPPETPFHPPFHETENTVSETLYTETETPPESETPKPTEQVSGGRAASPPPRSMAPLHDRSHHKHALCGRICLHASQFGEFVRRRNHDGADAEVRTWAFDVITAWTDGEFGATEPGDPFDFWRARYAERWPAAAPAGGGKYANWQPPERVSR